MLSSEQQSAIDHLFHNHKKQQVQTLGGYAGTGKTTIISNLVDKYEEAGIRPIVLAYTGKAVNVLKNKDVPCQTIHSLLYTPMIDHEGNVEGWMPVCNYNITKNCDIIIVDESSMVDSVIYNDLVDTGLPLIFVGDHGQLEPISNANDFNLMRDPDLKLEEIHRNSGEIAHFAEHLRKGKSPASFPSSSRVQIVTCSAVKPKHYADYDQVICLYNKTRTKINITVREYKKIHFSYIAIGEKIICLKNNHLEGLFNGMQGIVTKVHKNEKLSFTSNNVNYKNVSYDPDQFGKEKNDFRKERSTKNPFDYAYAITCHKAQGDEWDDIIVYEEVNNFCDTSRWRYTAASRARNSIIWIPTLF